MSRRIFALVVLAACAEEARVPCEKLEGQAHPADDALAADRLRCAFSAPQKTTETVASRPHIEKVEHVIVVMQENRSFDHYFSKLPGQRHPVAADASNPNARGGKDERYEERLPCFGGELDPPHEWADAHLSYAAGRMDGFVAAGGCGAMAYYTQQEIPYYYALASAFATSERHFASLIGPTWPNHYFFWLGTSCGLAEDLLTNVTVENGCAWNRPSILTRLAAAGVRTKAYEESLVKSFYYLSGIDSPLDIPATLEQFETDAAQDKLPPVAFVGATPYGHDEHPPTNINDGEHFVSRVVSAIMKNPKVWATSVLFITYDEYGGFYDHVTPPKACDPSPDEGHRDYAFDQYGFRVPLIVVSPFAKHGYVSDVDSDHTSITRFIEARWDLASLTVRDANAWPLFDMFDFDNPPNLVPPSLPDAPAPDPSQCQTSHQATCKGQN